MAVSTLPFNDPAIIPCPHCAGELYDGTVKAQMADGKWSEATWCRWCLGCIKCPKAECVHEPAPTRDERPS